MAAIFLTPGATREEIVAALRTYHWIVVNSSAGKDSQAMLDYVVELAKEAGVLKRVVVVHCDLGRVEWEGTKELARKQAAHYGVRFEVVKRDQDLLDHVAQKGKWPGFSTRYCTSDHKTHQVYKLFTELAASTRGPYPRRHAPKVRFLNCLGLRAQESTKRAAKPYFEHDKSASNATVRDVDTWLPIHRWTEDQVWARIAQSGVEHHYAYDLGMPRLSCVFCIYAPPEALELAGFHNRGLLREYAAVEEKTGHKFTVDGNRQLVSLVQIEAKLAAGHIPGAVTSWNDCAA